MATVAGCRGESAGATVEGQVTHRGEPLANASLTFFPTSGRPTMAATGTEGDYSVELLPGNYQVVVSLSAELPPDFKEGDPVPPPKLSLPDNYTTRAKTTLSATVAPDQSEPIDFNLK